MTTVTTTPLPLAHPWSPCPPLVGRARGPRQLPVAVLVLQLLLAPWHRRPRPSLGAARVAVDVVAAPVTLVWWAVVATLGALAFLGALVGAAFLGLIADGT
jgi:hypothetical protein